MTTKTTVIAVGGVAFGLLLGSFLTGRAGAQQPYPQQYPPQYQQAAPSVRWQYKCITKAQERIWAPEAQNMINSEGAQGWRLMENRPIWPNGYSDVYCFERKY